MLLVSFSETCFSFGSVVRAELISDISAVYQAYQDFFCNNFNYAVIENQLKWKQMEDVQVYILCLLYIKVNIHLKSCIL